MTYQLNLSIDQTGLQNIYNANQSVTIAKSGAGNTPIAWLTFQPFQTNLVSWMPNYYFYASGVTEQAGANILVNSITSSPAQLGWTYVLAEGFFTGTSGTGATYNATNQQSSRSSMLLGLAQSANINGVTVSNSPFSAAITLLNQTASFTPIETVSLFLSSYTGNGVFLSQVPSNALTVAFTAQAPVANVGYNDQTNTFYLISTSLAKHSMVELVGV